VAIWCFEGLILQGQPAQNVQMALSLVSDNAVSLAGGFLSCHAGGNGGGLGMRTSSTFIITSSVTISPKALFKQHGFLHPT